MKFKLSMLSASLVTALSAQATTAEYSWEDGATILGSFSASHLIHTQSSEQSRTGNFSLKIEDADTSDNSTTQSYIGWVNGLTDGDTVTASLWVYDDQDDRPAGRLWAHYTDDASDATSFAGSAGGNSEFTTGAGWQELTFTWGFDSDGGTRDGMMIHFRLFDSSAFPTGSLYLDDLAITPSAGNITLVDGTVIEVDDGDDGGVGDDPVELVCGDTATPIHTIQGDGEATPLDGETVTVEAIVTADFQDALSGIYLQTVPGTEDDNANTSEGIFVFTGSESLDVAVGNQIRLSATAGEFRDVTQLSNVTAMSVCAETVDLPAATTLTLPFDVLPEAQEGMLVSFENLTVNDVFQLGRFGTATLSNGRRFIPTQVAAPGDAAAAIEAANDLNKIILDDGSNQQNPEVVPYPTGGLSAANSLRVGDTMSMAQGVLTYAFGDYRIHPTGDVLIENTNPRTDGPELSGDSNLKVATFNVLNYFTTLDARGADTAEEFDRQQAKIVAALTALDSDVLGLVELENNGFADDSAIASLTAALDEADPEMGWSYVTPPVEQIGTDAIMVGFLYRNTVVTPVGDAAILDSSNSATDGDGEVLFLDTKNRPALAQEFTLNDSEESVVVVVNHFKSKGSDCDDVNDPNTGDGQGNCNLTRTRAAQAVASWVDAEFADKPVLILGDLNAYAQEDPLTALADAGYTELFEHLDKTDAYSFVFGGESGQLDHALVNEALLSSVVDVAEWNINADEPISLDYNVEFKSDTQVVNYFAPDAYRSSDHDPLIVALNLVPESTDSGDTDDQPVDTPVANSSSGGSLSAGLLSLLSMFAGFRLFSRRK